MPFEIPEYVVADEVIETAWGNSIVDALAWLERRKGVNRAAAAQFLPAGVSTDISFGTTLEDTDSYITSAINVTVPTGLGGVYGITFRYTATAGPSDIMIPSIWVGGVQYPGQGVQTEPHLVTFVLPVAEGQVVSAQMYNGGTGITGAAQLTMYRITA